MQRWHTFAKHAACARTQTDTDTDTNTDTDTCFAAQDQRLDQLQRRHAELRAVKEQNQRLLDSAQAQSA